MSLSRMEEYSEADEVLKIRRSDYERCVTDHLLLLVMVMLLLLLLLLLSLYTRRRYHLVEQIHRVHRGQLIAQIVNGQLVQLLLHGQTARWRLPIESDPPLPPFSSIILPTADEYALEIEDRCDGVATPGGLPPELGWDLPAPGDPPELDEPLDVVERLSELGRWWMLSRACCCCRSKYEMTAFFWNAFSDGLETRKLGQAVSGRHTDDVCLPRNANANANRKGATSYFRFQRPQSLEHFQCQRVSNPAGVFRDDEVSRVNALEAFIVGSERILQSEPRARLLPRVASGAGQVPETPGRNKGAAVAFAISHPPALKRDVISVP
uniref:Uncharacterized protein n=1 Tax=Anopheles farauti TaxID=69004 RepID=A0A182QZ79_9DIPT